MDELICAFLSHTHNWYEVVMLKVPAYIYIYIYKEGVRAGGLSPPLPFPFPRGLWGSGKNGDTDVPSAKECAVVVGDVVFEMQ